MSAAIQLSLLGPTVANDAARATPTQNDTRPRLRLASKQENLFAGAQPAPSFQAHATTREPNEDGGEDVVVRLRVISEAHVAAAEERAVSATDLTTAEWMAVAEDKPLPLVVREPLVRGSLTYAECLTWEDPCGLLKCRHRLDYATEKRTRTTDADGAVVAWGDWCALRVATHDPGEADDDREKRVAHVLGLSVAKLRAEVEAAAEACGMADYELNDALEDFQGAHGRQHKFVFEPEGPDVTSKECLAIVVPGEEVCQCECPMGDKGKTCSTCSVRIKRGRMAPTVRSHPAKAAPALLKAFVDAYKAERGATDDDVASELDIAVDRLRDLLSGKFAPRPRLQDAIAAFTNGAVSVRRWDTKADQWSGVVRRVPNEFVRADGSTVTTVSATFLEPSRPKDVDLRSYSMDRMLAARGKVGA